MGSLLYVAFFLSGVSGLIYQITWVRQFGNVLGNTVHSAALVVAVFMLGLGVGSYVAGVWADRRRHPGDGRLLRAYVAAEVVLAVLGLAVSLLVPRLAALVAGWSSYTIGPGGWQELSTASHAGHAAAVIVLLTPVTVTMGATLTLLIRHLVRVDVGASGWQIARLYGANTVGAAAGAVLADFALVRLAGLQATQVVAAGLNLAAAAIAAWALRGAARREPALDSGPTGSVARHGGSLSGAPHDAGHRPLLVPAAALCVCLSGVAVMGMEMVWVRHLGILLGGFRAVFSLVLAVLLAANGLGALAGGWLLRRWGRPAELLAAAQALFVVSALAGLACGRRGGAGGGGPGHRRDARGARAAAACAGRDRVQPGARTARGRGAGVCRRALVSAGECARATVGRHGRPSRGPPVLREHGRRGGRFARRRLRAAAAARDADRGGRARARGGGRPRAAAGGRRLAPRHDARQRLRPLSRSPRGRRFPPTSWWRARRWCRAATACSRAARGSPKWSPSSRPIAAGRS